MLRFANPEYLNALYLLIPLMVLLYWVTQRLQERQLKSFASEKLQKVLTPLRSKGKGFVKFGMLSLAAVLLVIALANPQIGTKIEEVKQVGIDVFIILDVSLSMQAEDIKPSRLAKAKYDINKLIRKLRGDRIGLIVFSGAAYVQFPLTTDYAAANLFLNAVDVTTVPQPGTAIASAIKLAQNSFPVNAADNRNKAIVVITDGEDHEGNLKDVVENAVNHGIAVYAIGLGSSKGVPIPIYNDAGVKVGRKKDNQGNIVLTKLDETTLMEITSIGNGQYYRGSTGDDALDRIYTDLSNLEEGEYGAKKVTEYEDRFYYFLLPALLLLIIEFFISGNRVKFLMNIIDRRDVKNEV